MTMSHPHGPPLVQLWCFLHGLHVNWRSPLDFSPPSSPWMISLTFAVSAPAFRLMTSKSSNPVFRWASSPYIFLRSNTFRAELISLSQLFPFTTCSDLAPYPSILDNSLPSHTMTPVPSILDSHLPYNPHGTITTHPRHISPPLCPWYHYHPS